MFQTRPKNNSNLFLKLLLRKSLIDLKVVNKGVALDLFAGGGEIAGRLYRDFRELHLVEKDGRKFARLQSAFSNCPGGRLWKMNNLEFLKGKLHTLSGLSLVDFDAYGSPNKQLQLFFQNWKIKAPLLVFATDGFILARIRGSSFSPELYLAGPDQAKGAGYDPVLFRNFEILLRGFWDELAKLHNFRVSLLKILRKKGGQIAYYGTFIEPK